ncbi:MAG: hypothetical protein J6C84_03415 [Lachnospiraceae bacterium]|nr:hypothetical protein [Lachnospiraceae bacterium]
MAACGSGVDTDNQRKLSLMRAKEKGKNMIISRDEYFRKFGFKEDPFASTNALQEELLEDCFVVPPYFPSLVGSSKMPKSSFVIAPRGTGKTAQRVMLEKLAEKENWMLAVVYDEFPIESVSNLNCLTLEDHLKRIMKSLIIAFLTELNNRPNVNLLEPYQKTQLKKLIELYLYGINSIEVENTIKKIRGISGKLEDLWCKAGDTITSIINAIATKQGMGNVDLSAKKKEESYELKDISSHYDFMEELFQSIGISAVYVLVDSIDETAVTGNNAEKSYHLIRPFILDLRLLERKTIVFKFFVWDKIERYWAEEFRNDRIENFHIQWRQHEIKELLSKRLMAYSDGKFSVLEDIFACDEKYIEYIYIFANNSPRDAINIMKSIFDEHLRINGENAEKPTEKAIVAGIEIFCKTKFEEMVAIDKQRQDLKRIKQATFTIPYLYNDIFKCESSTARNIPMPWTQAGIVYGSSSKIKVRKSKHPINVYTFADIRIARYVCSNQKLYDGIDKHNFIR